MKRTDYRDEENLRWLIQVSLTVFVFFEVIGIVF